MTQATYSQLDTALSSLGLSVRLVTDEKKLRVYTHKETGAQLALAYRPDSEIVLPHHMAAVQGTLKVYGIADPLDFAARFQEASGRPEGEKGSSRALEAA